MPHRLFQFETSDQPLSKPVTFYWRLASNGAVGLSMVAVSLAAGMLGYRVFENQSWIDSFVSAAMILGGMGPVAPLMTDAGKLFAGLYALYSGLLLIFVTGVLLAPMAHRVLHHFNVETEADEDKKDRLAAAGKKPPPRKPAR